jgi:aurora kinase
VRAKLAGYLRRCLDDYDLEKQLYRGKASLLYSATCRHSGQRVVLKLYRKHKLSELNWYQVQKGSDPSMRQW